jgi:hypothetical protein
MARVELPSIEKQHMVFNNATTFFNSAIYHIANNIITIIPLKI